MVQKDNMKGSTNKNFVFNKAKLRVQQTETKGPTKQNYRLDKTNYGSNEAKLQWVHKNKNKGHSKRNKVYSEAKLMVKN